MQFSVLALLIGFSISDCGKLTAPIKVFCIQHEHNHSIPETDENRRTIIISQAHLDNNDQLVIVLGLGKVWPLEPNPAKDNSLEGPVRNLGWDLMRVSTLVPAGYRWVGRALGVIGNSHIRG